MGDQYSEAAVKLGQYIAPALDREITDEDYPLFDLLLDFAKDKIFSQGYPFGNRPDELPSQYQSLQIRIAAELYNHIGATDRRAIPTMALLVCGKVPMWHSPC